jgi:hypothetical protein
MPSQRERARRHTLAFVTAVAFLALVFHDSLSANPGSRILTVLGLVENGTLRADAWRDLTIDGAFVGGHFYSDKAPLSSFLVVPFFFVWRALVHRPLAPLDLDVAVFLGDVVTAALPFAAFTALLRRSAARWTSARDAVWIALMAAFGSCVFVAAGAYVGNVLAGALFVFAYHLAACDLERRATLAGFLAGLAVLSEYPMLVGAALLGVYVATRGVKLAARFAMGAAPCAAVMLAYDAAITGSPFDLPQRHVRALFFPPWGRRFALDAQTLHAARMLLFSEYRGLLVYAPLLLVLFPLAIARAESSARRGLLLAIACAQFTFVASYWMWDGGWSIGPRHLVALIMLLTYEGVGALARTPRAQLPFVGLASAGLALNLVAVATNPFVEGFMHPFNELYWPAFARGEITPHNLFSFVLGLHPGQACVFLWCALFLATGVTFARLASRHAAA